MCVVLKINAFGEHVETSPSFRGGTRPWYKPAYDPYSRSWKHVILLPVGALAVFAALAYGLLHGGLDQYDLFTTQNPDTSCVSNEQSDMPHPIIDPANKC